MSFLKPDIPEPPKQEIVSPAAPVEEASVEIDDEQKKKKASTSKSSLKMPLAPVSNAGLKV